ncbi:MAG: hypothetical protein IPM23_26090 [Candidatus Melainabacteria bacterium]|nr:hypothetical protein [Candidatus Melainabacteria bacterium]
MKDRSKSLSILVFIPVILAVLAILPLTAYGATHELAATAISGWRILLVVAGLMPQLLNLLLVLVSLYLMLDGVRRWGTNKDGAFERTLIGLFILHSMDGSIFCALDLGGVPFVPYLALALQIGLCLGRGNQESDCDS